MDIPRFSPDQDPAGNFPSPYPDRAGQGIEPIDINNPASPAFWAKAITQARGRYEIPTALAPPNKPITFDDSEAAARHEAIRLRAAQIEARRDLARREKQRRNSPRVVDTEFADGPHASPSELNTLLQSVLDGDNLDPDVRALVEGIKDYTSEIHQAKIPVRARLIRSLFRLAGRQAQEIEAEPGSTIIPGTATATELDKLP